MKARPFKARDLVSVNKWLRRHGHPNAQLSELPAIGFIVPGVAVGFIRNCENGIGMLDSFATNKLCSKLTRNSALNIITSSLLSKDFKHFIAITADTGLINRFNEYFNFVSTGEYQWLVKAGN